jgi:hypothetical protein
MAIDLLQGGPTHVHNRSLARTLAQIGRHGAADPLGFMKKTCTSKRFKQLSNFLNRLMI